VNPLTSPANVKIALAGTRSLSTKGTAITLAGNPDDTNSIDYPKKIMPVTTTVHGIKPTFDYTMPAYSVVVLKLSAQP